MDDVQLTPERANRLRQLEAQVQQAQGLLNRAKRAGLPESMWGPIEQQLLQAETMRRGLLREFTPGETQRRRG